MGKAGILLTLVAGIGAAVVFQNLLRLPDNDEFPADELLTNELKSAAALVTGTPGFDPFVCRRTGTDFLRQNDCHTAASLLRQGRRSQDGDLYSRRQYRNSGLFSDLS